MPEPPPTAPCALITGVTGFVGSYLAEALLARGERVVGVSRHAIWPAGCAHLAGAVQLHALDLCDGEAVEALLRQARPCSLYHLAGYASAGKSFQQPEAAWQGNLTATRRLYEAVARWGGRPRILFVGSGMVYGDCAEPPTEDSPLRPASPYAASKAAADLVSYQVTCDPGLDVVRVRPFNHIGPRQSPQFALAHFAQQIVAIERGQAEPVLQTGDLRPQRDLTDVRDVVSAYLLLMEKGRTGEAYNVASGTTLAMRAVLQKLLELSGRKVDVRSREDLLRPTEPMALRADTGKLRGQTGWRPRYSLEQTLADILEYWRRV